MKISHLSTFDLEGGAGRAAYRLHQGLQKIGEDSSFLSLYSTVNNTIDFSLFTSEKSFKSSYFDYIQKYHIDRNRTEVSNTLFSLGYDGLNLAQYPLILDSDILNLHWINSGFLSPITINNLLQLGKPIIWTLHDMWSFTGGCHYSAECQKYLEDCSNCPQLLQDNYQLAHHLLLDKIELFSHPNLVIVTPSNWLAECAKKSQVFRNQRVEIIPYSLDTSIFQPTNKIEAKKLLNINPETIVLLAGAVTGKEKRKGFLELINALKICLQEQDFFEKVKENQIKICCFGEANQSFQELGIETIFFGNIKDDRQLSLIYSLADIFILPSLEDNFPNTMLEAMSCKTPVIAFNIGGIPDLVEDYKTGFLVPKNNLYLLSERIRELINDRLLREKMGKEGREIIVKNYALSVQAKNYLQLYQDLLKNNKQDKIVRNNNLQIGTNFQKIYDKLALISVAQELENKQQIIAHQQEEINRLKGELIEKQNHIEAMKSSKFWYLRDQWFKLKQRFQGNIDR